jgi:hypothetical protein
MGLIAWPVGRGTGVKGCVGVFNFYRFLSKIGFYSYLSFDELRLATQVDHTVTVVQGHIAGTPHD